MYHIFKISGQHRQFFHVFFWFLRYDSSHEIMVHFVLRKLILQTCMCSHPVGFDVSFLVGPFVYFHTSCVQTAMAPARLRGWVGLPEHLLVTYLISTIILAGSYLFHMHLLPHSPASVELTYLCLFLFKSEIRKYPYSKLANFCMTFIQICILI